MYEDKYDTIYINSVDDDAGCMGAASDGTNK